jgi:hypothetical protein
MELCNLETLIPCRLCSGVKINMGRTGINNTFTPLKPVAVNRDTVIEFGSAFYLFK